MFRKIPPVATPISARDLWSGFKTIFGSKSYIEEFESALSDYFGTKYCFTTSSGKTAFYVILKALRHFSAKREVILPAYTDAGLVLVIQKVGLKPVLCDISSDTFNLDLNLLPQVVSNKTFCVVPVHMFGLACDITQIIADLRRFQPEADPPLAEEPTIPGVADFSLRLKGRELRRIFVVEDGAQAQGTQIRGQGTGDRRQRAESRMVGTVGDVGFYSFNRGKNFPTYSGGFVVTNSQELAEAIGEELRLLPEPGIFSKYTSPVKLSLLALAVNPFIYKLLYKLISPFKSTTVPKDFTASLYTEFQAGAGLSLLRRLSDFSERRFHNGSALYEGLKGIDGIILPKILPNSKPAYNRLPLVFEDINLREKVYQKLLREGIEPSRMYPRPLHHVFDLGYSQKKEPFPNAAYFADRLLTLPTHPFVDERDIETMINVIRVYGETHVSDS